MPSATKPPPALLKALTTQDLEIVDTVELDVTQETADAVRAARPMERTVDFALEVGDKESAVVIIEQDGVYSWHLPSEIPDATVRTRGGPGKREVHFSITLGRSAGDTQEFKRRGFVSDFIVGKVRTFILKYVVEWGTGKLMHYLERNVQPGLVNMSSSDPAEWTRLDKLDQLPISRSPARIMLFLHGTFSSTLGSYGALGATTEGQQLLQTMQRSYDAVIGFDHPTLSLTPEENAQALLDALQSFSWEVPPHIDIVTFSRGGLVYRAFSELLLPKTTWRPHIDRVIFVAVPNAGTHLAEPDNWHALLDLYTNLAAAAGKLLSKIPQLTIATKIFNELIQSLGALAKYLASQAVTEGDIPGLAAMEPDGPFITELNLTQVGQPSVTTTFYCAVTSEFEATIRGGTLDVPKEFPKRLAMTLVDQVADRLFDVANDLVVDTPSMTAIDKISGNFIKDQFSFGKNPYVYHTVYFAQPEVALALSRWLQLDQQASEARRSGSGDWVAAGETAASVLSPEVDTNILVTTASETLEALYDDLDHNPDAEFVVVRRPYEGRLLNYAYRRNEVEELGQGWGKEIPLLDGLGMHEFQESESRSTAKIAMEGPPPSPGSSEPTVNRVVVLDDDRPVGVVPEPYDFGADFEQSESEAEMEEEATARLTSYRGGELEPPPIRLRRRASRTERAIVEGYKSSEKVEVSGSLASIQCHFYAEMPGTVTLGEDASLLVSVSRELIKAAAGMAKAAETAEINPSRRIILDARARQNFAVVGSARAEIDPPAAGETADVYFSLRPTDLEEGEVWVTARQGQVPLVTLKLRVLITATQPEVAPPISARASTDEPLKIAAPLCQLRIFERSNGENISYEYDLDIPGVIFDRYASPSIRSDRSEYVKNLYKEIEQRWYSTQQDMDAFSEEMREMGGSLFGQLFPLELQRALWENRDAIRHIQVISTEPFIPWEIVHLTEPGHPLPGESLFLAQFGVVRWLHGSYFPNEVRIRNGRAHYIIPDYPHPDDKLPGTVDEVAYLNGVFQATPLDPHPLPVRQILRGPGAFDLLHFAGHGVAEGDDIVNSQLQLEGRVENGKVIPEYLSSTAVEQQSRLKGTDNNCPMVVLNACQAGRIGFRLTGMGGFASAFLSRGAGIFISALWSVSDKPAKDFVLKLYDELRGGAELADAVIKAREVARASGDASWLCYVVYGHPNARIIMDD
jgi:hypothetical protein